MVLPEEQNWINEPLSRRKFLKRISLALVGLGVSACVKKVESFNSTLTPEATPKKAPTTQPESTATQETGTTVPDSLFFLDGRNVKTLVSHYAKDPGSGFLLALDKKNIPLAFLLEKGNLKEWVTHPYEEKGFPWNFEKNGNGTVILHNILEQWGYKPKEILGVKFLNKDQVPKSFWDESDPVRKESKYQHPWPEQGTLAVLDSEGDILIYYSIQEKKWMYAAYQEELPGNMVFREPSSMMEIMGVRHKSVSEEDWTDKDDRFKTLRNMIDWFSYTKRTGNTINFDQFVKEEKDGKTHPYNSWVFDLEKNDYTLKEIDSKTKMFIYSYLFGSNQKMSRTVIFKGDGNQVDGRTDWVSAQKNPDDSLNIMYGDQYNDWQSPSMKPYFYSVCLRGSLQAFLPSSVGILAASDEEQKETGLILKAGNQWLPDDVNEKWAALLVNPSSDLNTTKVTPENALEIENPIIRPDIMEEKKS
jgi:hypothetical protein